MAFPLHRSTVIQGSFLGNQPRIQISHHRVEAVQPAPARGPAMQLPPALLQLRPHGAGQRLPEAIQRKMESLFNADFSDVRVHVGGEATAIGALAFAHGPDLYFAHGQYNPSLPHGQRLLGHELTHVLQQKAGRARNPFGSGIAVVQDPGLEAEAERMGLRASQGSFQSPPGALQAAPALSPPLPSKQVLQPANEPWTRTGAGIYGRQNRLTFSEAVGTTGGANTTILDATINGNFFGKFENVAHHMGGTGRAQLLANGYPALCTMCAGGDKPHAEDYLLTALETEWNASGGNWFTRYPDNGNVGQQKAVLSIRINKAPCPRCASNLKHYCRARNLAMRIKASRYHYVVDPVRQETGTEYLDRKGYPVRQWDVNRMLIKAPSGAPAHLPTWENNQLGRKGNSYRTTTRSNFEVNESVTFANDRANFNIPRTTGWSAHSANLTRANLNN